MSKIITGIFGMEDDEYFTKEGLSNSSFRLLSESALHLENEKLFKLSGKAFSFGTLVHLMTFEPEKVDNLYTVEKFDNMELSKNSKLYKESKIAFYESVKDKEIVSAEDWEKASTMARNVRVIAKNIMGGKPEQALMCGIDGVQMKGRVDLLNTELKLFIDLKTTQSIKTFDKSIYDYNYGSQMTLYKDMLKIITGDDYTPIFLIVETSKPYNVRIAELDLETMEIARGFYSEMVQRWKLWQSKRVLEGIIKKVGVPSWVKRQHGYEV